MTAVICALVATNLFITGLLAYHLSNLRKAARDIKMLYFVEVTEVSGFIRSQRRGQVKCQMMIGDIPVGTSFVVSEQVCDSVDKQRLDQLINHVAKPLINLGIQIAIKTVLPG